MVMPPIQGIYGGVSRTYPSAYPPASALTPAAGRALAILFEVRDLDGARRASQPALRRALRQRCRVDRQYAAGRAAPALSQAGGEDLREARGAQPDRLG